MLLQLKLHQPISKETHDYLLDWQEWEEDKHIKKLCGSPGSGFREMSLLEMHYQQFGILYFFILTINARVLLDKQESPECVKPEEIDKLGHAFNEELDDLFGGAKVFKYLPHFDGWDGAEVWYVADFDLGAGVTDILTAIRKTDLPWEHSASAKAQADFLRPKSPILNVYDKAELVGKGYIDYLNEITPELRVAVKGQLRFTVGCSRGKINEICKKHGENARKTSGLLNPGMAREVMLTACERTVGKGAFTNREQAEKIINEKCAPKDREELFQLLDIIERAGSIPKAREEDGRGSRYFNRSLAKLRNLGVNGVLMERGMETTKSFHPYETLETYFSQK